MNKNTKIIVGVVSGVCFICIVLCIVGYFGLGWLGKSFVNSALTEDPQKVRTIASEMADYDLPPAYHEQMVMNMVFVKMLFLVPENMNLNDPMIMLAQMNSNLGGMSEEQMEAQVQQSAEQNFNKNGASVHLVDQHSVTIRNQDVMLYVYEGVDENGNPIRENVTTFFDGKNGKLMLMIMGRIEGWNQAELDAFITSIH
jgi:hypothetical protein